MHTTSPPKSYKTHSLISMQDGNPKWILDFTPSKEGGWASVTIALRPDNGYTRGGMTITLPRNMGKDWGFERQSSGDYWFQIGTDSQQKRLAVDFCRQFWDFLVTEGRWEPLPPKVGA